MRMDQETSFIAERAAEWLQELKGGGHRQRSEFWKWLNASPAHVQEALLAKACDTVLAHLFHDRSIDPDSFTGRSHNVHDLAERRCEDRPTNDRRDLCEDAAQTAPPRRTPSITAKIAAAITALMLTLLLGVIAKVVWWDRTLVTHASEWKTHTLTDGSTLRMGPHTRVRIDFGDSRRIVRLVRGEVVFEVAHDARRPFLVSSDSTVVRAVGTRFGLAAIEGSLHVTVAEGVVAVSRGVHAIATEMTRRGSEDDSPVTDEADGNRLQLGAGEQVVVDGSAPLAVRRVDARAVLAWANGWLICRDHTLAEVVREFNRRNRVQIELVDPVLSTENVTGALRLDQPEKLAAMVARSLPNLALETESDVLRIERRGPGRRAGHVRP